MNRNKPKRNLPYFLAELLILIIGITVSFALNEYRQDRKEGEQEILLLKSFKDDLVRDSTVLSFGIDLMTSQIEASQKLVLLEPKATFSDSAVINTVTLLSYIPFSPQNIAYEEMKSLGNTHIIKNDSLAKGLIGLYENYYENIFEWSSIDKDHVKNKLINFTINKFPFASNLDFTSLSDQKKRQFMSAIKTDEFKHLVQWGLLYKASTNATFDSALVSIRALIEQIDAEVPED